MPDFIVPVEFTVTASTAEAATKAVKARVDDELCVEFGFTVFEAYDSATVPGAKTAITKADIEALIERSAWSDTKLGVKTTVVCLTLPNGFEIVETASCVDPANYDHNLGVTTARKRVIDKLWLLEGYRLACELQDDHLGTILDGLVVDLRKMDAEGAIELGHWPNALALVDALA
jgi:hypothetical protein